MTTQTQSQTAAVSVPHPMPHNATTWNIDTSHSVAHFTVRHMMVTNVRGQFSGVTGSVTLTPDLSLSSVTANIDVSTVDTREAKRDAHLRSPDFFDVEKHPFMSFVSKSIESIEGNTFKLRGDLTLHGVTNELVLEVELADGESKDPYGNLRRGAQGTIKLNRKDFNLGWNVVLETGGIAVSDTVKVEIELALIKA